MQLVIEIPQLVHGHVHKAIGIRHGGLRHGSVALRSVSAKASLQERGDSVQGPPTLGASAQLGRLEFRRFGSRRDHVHLRSRAGSSPLILARSASRLANSVRESFPRARAAAPCCSHERECSRDRRRMRARAREGQRLILDENTHESHGCSDSRRPRASQISPAPVTRSQSSLKSSNLASITNQRPLSSISTTSARPPRIRVMSRRLMT